MAGASWELPTDGGGPDVDAELVAAVGDEYGKLIDLETVARADIPLPDGLVWTARLQVTRLAGAWLVRATLLPLPLSE